MCGICQKEVSEQDIRESDLPALPFKEVKWRCIVPGCKGGARLRDYGNAPYYYWATKEVKDHSGYTRRGGWFNIAVHYYLCSRHWKQAERVGEMMSHRITPEYLLSKITEWAKGKRKGKMLQETPHFLK